jgi:hypothetical protein
MTLIDREQVGNLHNVTFDLSGKEPIEKDLQQLIQQDNNDQHVINYELIIN